jgi:hypothetical protein
MQEEFAKQVGQYAAETFLQKIFVMYHNFVGMFPDKYQWIVSLFILLAVASFLWKLIRKNILWAVLLIILFPGYLPILKNLFDSLTSLIIGINTYNG